MDKSPRKIAVVAIGGNSLIKDEKHKTVEDQYQAAKATTYHIADMIEAGWDVAIGHGNEPQVGFDRNDKAFQKPSKPIGGFMDQAEAKRRANDMGWSIVEDAGRGWRRV